MSGSAKSKPRIKKQAVVIVHGMGEQRPGDALNAFIDAGLPRGADGRQRFYSRPDIVSGSYETRRFLAPRDGVRPKTEFFEYHWAHLMQGNKLGDLWPTMRRMLLTPMWRVPSGLRVVWSAAWLLILAVAWALSAWGPLSEVSITDTGLVEKLARAVLGGGVTATLLIFVASRMLPKAITASFVDVVRYLDTSPRSYEVRRQIRKGLVEMLENLHAKEYDRIILVAHSLGAYIAYDGISYLWGAKNHLGRRVPLDGLAEAQEAAAVLLRRRDGEFSAADLDRFRAAQRKLWWDRWKQDNPWRISDLVTVGTPMYFADRLHTGDRATFDKRVLRGELPVCPPISDPELAIERSAEGTSGQASIGSTPSPRFTWKHADVLHEAAPFAVVRWTNLWFPHHLGFFGDWFGGPLAGLFGRGVRDIAIGGNRPRRWTPALSHAWYFKFPDDTARDSVTTVLRDALDLDDKATGASG